MPKFLVEDTQTKKKFVFEGNTPPTDADIRNYLEPIKPIFTPSFARRLKFADRRLLELEWQKLLNRTAQRYVSSPISTWSLNEVCDWLNEIYLQKSRLKQDDKNYIMLYPISSLRF